MVKITDVARHAGVSPSTCLLRPQRQAPHLRGDPPTHRGQHPRTGLPPARRARALASSRSNVLALVVPLRAGIHVPVVMQFAVSVVTAARQHDHDVLLLTQEEGEEGLRRVADTALVDALIVMDVQLHDPRLPLLRALDRPSVLIGFPAGPAGLTCIDLDFKAAGELCVERLAGSGTGSWRWSGRRRRCTYGTAFAQRVVEGFTAAADRNGLALLVHPCEASPAAARRVAEQLLREQPALTGVVVHNEPVLEPLIDAFEQLGRRVPLDLSVTAILPPGPARRERPRPRHLRRHPVHRGGRAGGGTADEEAGAAPTYPRPRSSHPG